MQRRHWVYVIAYAASSLLMFGRQWLVARYLPVLDFGMYQQLLLFSSTSLFLADLGYGFLAQKRLPGAHLRGEARERLILISSAHLVFVGVVSVSATVLTLSRMSGVEVWTGPVFFLHAIAQHRYMLMMIDTRSALRTGLYTRMISVRAVGMFSGAIIAAVSTGSGVVALAAEAGVLLLLSFLFRSRTAFRAYSASLRGTLFRAIHSRWPESVLLLRTTGTAFIVISADRWLAVWVLTMEEYGIYAAAALILTAGDMTQAMVNQLAFPRFARWIDEGGIETAWSRALRLASVMLLFALLASPLVLVSLKYALPLLGPAFEGGISILPLMLLGGLFRAVNLFQGLGILFDKERLLSRLYVSIIATVCTLGAIVYASGSSSIRVFALVAVGTSIAGTVGAFVVCHRHVRANRNKG